MPANRSVPMLPAVTPAVVIMLLAMLLCAAPASAAPPPLTRAFPRETLVYVEGVLTENYRKTSSFDAMRKAGLEERMLLSSCRQFADLFAAVLRADVSPAEALQVMDGVRGMAGGLIDIRIGAGKASSVGVAWQAVCGHANLTHLQNLYERAFKAGGLGVVSRREVDGITLYNLDVHIELSKLLNFGGGGSAGPSLPDFGIAFSCSAGFGQDRYAVFGDSEARVRTAFDGLRGNIEGDTLADAPSVREASKGFGANSIGFFYYAWDEILKSAAKIGPAAEVIALFELDALRSYSNVVDYDAAANQLICNGGLAFQPGNMPAWYSIARCEPREATLLRLTGNDAVAYAWSGFDQLPERGRKFMEYFKPRVKKVERQFGGKSSRGDGQEGDTDEGDAAEDAKFSAISKLLEMVGNEQLICLDSFDIAAGSAVWYGAATLRPGVKPAEFVAALLRIEGDVEASKPEERSGYTYQHIGKTTLAVGQGMVVFGNEAGVAKAFERLASAPLMSDGVKASLRFRLGMFGVLKAVGPLMEAPVIPSHKRALYAGIMKAFEPIVLEARCMTDTDALRDRVTISGLPDLQGNVAVTRMTARLSNIESAESNLERIRAAVMSHRNADAAGAYPASLGQLAEGGQLDEVALRDPADPAGNAGGEDTMKTPSYGYRAPPADATEGRRLLLAWQSEGWTGGCRLVVYLNGQIEALSDEEFAKAQEASLSGKDAPVFDRRESKEY